MVAENDPPTPRYNVQSDVSRTKVQISPLLTVDEVISSNIPRKMHAVATSLNDLAVYLFSFEAYFNSSSNISRLPYSSCGN